MAGEAEFQLMLEPGRSLVASACILLTSVLGTKESKEGKEDSETSSDDMEDSSDDDDEVQILAVKKAPPKNAVKIAIVRLPVRIRVHLKVQVQDHLRV